MITWPIIKGTATLSGGLMASIMFTGKIVHAVLGEQINAGTSMSLGLFWTILCGVLVFCWWINGQFIASAKRDKEISDASVKRDKETTDHAASANVAALLAANSSTLTNLEIKKELAELKRQIENLPCPTVLEIEKLMKEKKEKS
jgi:hypothetical protein